MNRMNIVMVIVTLAGMVPTAFAALSGPAPIPNPPNFYITSNATTICRGQVNYIPVTVTNRASTSGNPYAINETASATIGPNPEMQNVVLNVANARDIYSVDNGTIDLGNILPNTSATGYLPMFATANASSLMSTGIDINYFYYTYYTDTEQRNLTLSTELCTPPLSVSLKPGILTAGSTQNLTVNITNTGATTINDITMNVKFPSQYVAWLGTQQISVPSLSPGQSVEKRSSIFVSYNASDEFAANVSAIFYNGSRIEQIYQNIEMLASGLIDLNTSGVTVTPAVPAPGSIFSLSFVLTNTGTSAASAVTATVVPVNGFSSFESNTTFIGSISADSQTPVTLTLEAGNRTAKGDYRIPVKVSYLNTVRVPVNQTIVIPVAVGSAIAFNSSAYAARRGGGASGIIEIIMLLAIIALCYLLYREKKAAKKQKQTK